MSAAAEMPAERDPQAVAREVRAERYFERDLAGQRRWYGERASCLEARTQILGTAVAAGAATTSCRSCTGRAGCRC